MDKRINLDPEHVMKGNSLEIENSSKVLLYSKEFREFLKNSPGIIKTFKQLESELEFTDFGIQLEKQGVTLIRFEPVFTEEDYSEDNKNRRGLYKLVFKGKEFFIKRQPTAKENEITIKGHHAINEGLSVIKAKKLLNDNKIEGVEIIPMSFAFRDKINSYYVSPWKNFSMSSSYINSMPENAKTEELLFKLTERYKKVEELLLGYDDIDSGILHNTFYDPSADILYFYDLHSSENSFLKPPK